MQYSWVNLCSCFSAWVWLSCSIYSAMCCVSNHLWDTAAAEEEVMRFDTFFVQSRVSMWHVCRLSILSSFQLTDCVRPLFNYVTWYTWTREERNRSVVTENQMIAEIFVDVLIQKTFLIWNDNEKIQMTLVFSIWLSYNEKNITDRILCEVFSGRHRLQDLHCK